MEILVQRDVPVGDENRQRAVPDRRSQVLLPIIGRDLVRTMGMAEPVGVTGAREREGPSSLAAKWICQPLSVNSWTIAAFR